jgi:hypothetical protein
MAQLSITLSDKALSLIAQLQKEIFNRRRKKVSAAGVVETLVESGAKSQSDKRFATSWKNLVSDIEKAAKFADANGSKPSTLSDEEWAIVLSHRSRPVRRAVTKTVTKTSAKAATKPAVKRATKTAVKPAAKRAAKSVAKPAVKAAAAVRKTTAAKLAAKAPMPRTKRSSTATSGGTGSVAKRMAKAASKLASNGSPSSAEAGSVAALPSLT